MKKLGLFIVLCAVAPSFALAGGDISINRSATTSEDRIGTSTVYIVRKGDTLSQIANMFNVPVAYITEVNGSSTLMEGKKISIPATAVYIPTEKQSIQLEAVDQLGLQTVNESGKTELEKRAIRREKIDTLIASYGNDPAASEILLLVKLLIALDIIQI